MFIIERVGNGADFANIIHENVVETIITDCGNTTIYKCNCCSKNIKSNDIRITILPDSELKYYKTEKNRGCNRTKNYITTKSQRKDICVKHEYSYKLR